MNVVSYLLENGKDEDIVLITEQSEFNYGALRQAVAAMAVRLRAAGVSGAGGDGSPVRVCLLSDNNFFWVASYLAILTVGAVVVPVPTTICEPELGRLLAFADCCAVCMQGRYRAKLSAAVGALPVLEDGSNWAQGGGEKIVPVSMDKNAEALLLMTSGTTSRPSLVRISHHNLHANTRSILSYLHLTSLDRIMTVLPLSYCFGLSLLNTHLRVGGSLVMNNRFAFPEVVLDHMEATACTGFAGVPFMFHTLLRATTLPQRSLPALTKIQQAGGHLPPILIEELQKTLPDAQIFVMYGQTEATARLSYLPPARAFDKAGSIGMGLAGTVLRVVDEAGAETAVGEMGEIVAEGDNVALGYLDDEAATRAKFVDGVLYTGDIGLRDEDGFIFIVDRKSDILKPFGMRVSSRQIEACVMKLRGLLAVAAVSVPDLARGEAIHLFAVAGEGADVDEAAIIQHCRAHGKRMLVPSRVTFIEQMPLNGRGKILRNVLRKRALVAVSAEQRIIN